MAQPLSSRPGPPRTARPEAPIRRAAVWCLPDPSQRVRAHGACSAAHIARHRVCCARVAPRYGDTDRKAWAAETSAAVDSTLRDLLPTASAGSTASAADADAAAELPSAAAGSYFGASLASGSGGGGASALRISRQELDARVQQILGRHGQALATPGR